jgi:peptidylprolyl isomerase
VTVTGGTDLKHAPVVKSLSERAPATLQCMDLVVGKGKPATPTSTVSVQYVGVLYKDGTVFDSSWKNGGKPISFPLTRVVPGFTQGIGGAGKVAPMREGGRRIMILPASLGYGANANGSIPANSPLVFVVDLKKVTG